MSKEIDFLNECSAFYVLTLNDDYPTDRPFGAIMEFDNDLYISTEDTKNVYKQSYFAVFKIKRMDSILY